MISLLFKPRRENSTRVALIWVRVSLNVKRQITLFGDGQSKVKSRMMLQYVKYNTELCYMFMSIRSNGTFVMESFIITPSILIKS